MKTVDGNPLIDRVNGILRVSDIDLAKYSMFEDDNYYYFDRFDTFGSVLAYANQTNQQIKLSQDSFYSVSIRARRKSLKSFSVISSAET